MRSMYLFIFFISVTVMAVEQKNETSVETECPSFEDGVYDCQLEGKNIGSLRLKKGLKKSTIAYSFEFHGEAARILTCVDSRSEIFICGQSHRNRSALDSEYCKKEFSNFEIRKIEIRNSTKSSMKIYHVTSKKEVGSEQPYMLIEELESTYYFVDSNKIIMQNSRSAGSQNPSDSYMNKTFECTRR